jgi:hypothetical protein
MLILSGGFTGSYAQDPAVEIKDQTRQAVSQFKSLWLEKKNTQEALAERAEKQNREILKRLLSLGANPNSSCSPDRLQPGADDSAVVLRGEAIYKKTRTLLDDEIKQTQQLTREYDATTQQKSSYPTQISLFRSLNWSFARATMFNEMLQVITYDHLAIGEIVYQKCIMKYVLSNSNLAGLTGWASEQLALTNAAISEYATTRLDAYDKTIDLIVKLP